MIGRAAKGRFRRAVQLLVCMVAAAGGQGSADGMRVVRLDPRLDTLLAQPPRIDRIADGFRWLEGPVWNRAAGYLLFSDIPANAIYQWRPEVGIRLFLATSGYTGALPFSGREPGSNGLTYDADGRLVICAHGDRRIARLQPDGSLITLVDRWQGQRLNSPNDAVYHSNGDLYFTDPPFGLPEAFDDVHKELPFSGVYRLSPDGRLTLIIDDIKAPNGIAFSPDESVLYVSDVDPDRPAWLAYDMRADGRVGNGRVLVDARPWSGKQPGGPDGLKVDEGGYLFAAGPGGVYVFAPDGTHLGTLETGVATANVAWGEDGSVLFIAASSAVYRVATLTRGARYAQ